MSGAVAEDIQRTNALIVAEDLAAKFPGADRRQTALIEAISAKAATLMALDHQIIEVGCGGFLDGPHASVTREMADLLFDLGPLARIADTIAWQTFTASYRAITAALETQPAAGSA